MAKSAIILIVFGSVLFSLVLFGFSDQILVHPLSAGITSNRNPVSSRASLAQKSTTSPAWSDFSIWQCDRSHLPFAFQQFGCAEGILMPGMSIAMYFGSASLDWLRDWGETKEKNPAPKHNGTSLRYHPPAKLDESDWYEVEAIMFAVLNVKDRFVMLELGAGYGRWLAHAHCLLRSRLSPSDASATYLGVEADPYHFSQMKMNLAANGIPQHELMSLQGAVTSSHSDLRFIAGDPDKWWGAAIGSGVGTTYPVTSFLFKHILSPFWTIDHIDFDCQTCEGDVITDEVIAVLNKKVKSMWIECHSLAIGQALTDRFTKWGWHIVYRITPTATDFGYGSVSSENDSVVNLWVLNPKFYPDGKKMSTRNL